MENQLFLYSFSSHKYGKIVRRGGMFMYCHQCGKEVGEDMKYCPYCGTVMQNGQVYDQREYDAPSLLFAFVSFFIPIAGIVLYVIWRKEFPKKAASCLKGLVAGIIVEIILYIVFLSIISQSVNTFEDIYYEGIVLIQSIMMR